MNDRMDHVLAHLPVTGPSGQGYAARCPAHHDTRASLQITPGENGGVALHCHAGCDTQLVIDEAGLAWSDLSPEPHIVARYSYLDEDGSVLYEVERWEPKDFRCRPGLPLRGERRLYHSEWLNSARANARTVYIVEGEKDADTLAEHGEIALCGVGGAGSWLPHYADQLIGLSVVVIADADEPGRDHARAIVSTLDGKAKAVALYEPSFGKDVSDQLDAGYGLDTLIALSEHATLGVLRADHVRERPLTWLWPGYIPTGKLIMVEGDPGDGKSVMTLDLSARLSTGAPFPDGERTEGARDVILVSAEDDPEDTIRPRLRVAGANLSRIHMVTGGSVPDSPFDLRRDIGALELLINETNAGMLVIDPLMAFMPADLDAYRDAEVRRALHPVTRMAMRTGCAVVVVRHLNKSRGKAITAGGGSVAFLGAARLGYLIAPHPDVKEKRVLSAVKANISAKPLSLAYEIISCPTGEDLPVVNWDDQPLDLTAQQLLDGAAGDVDEDMRDEARDWLIEYLSSNHSGAKWMEILRAAKKEGFTDQLMRTVRKGLAEPTKNPTTRDGTVKQGTYWFLIAAKDRGRHLHVVPEDAPTNDGKPEPASPAPHLDPGPCDVCNGEPAVVFASRGVRRCASHNPMTYGG